MLWMNIETFKYILSKEEGSIKKESPFRESVPPAQRLAVTLKFLATGKYDKHNVY